MLNDWVNKFGSIQFCFYLTEENNKFKHYTDNVDEFSFAELKDEIEEILIFDTSNITSEHLEDKLIGPRINSAYEKLTTEK